MDNDNKINEHNLPSKAKAFFNNRGITAVSPELYSLENEFARTRKNRNLFVILSIFFFLVALVASSLFITNHLEKQAQDSSFSIKEFQDLNLKELLGKFNKNESALRAARQELEELRDSRSREVLQIRDAAAADREIIQAKAIPKEQKNEQIQNVSQREQRRIAAIRQTYASQIAEKQNQIEELEAEVRKYRQSLQEDTEKSQVVIDNYQKLHEMEKKRIRENYEERIQEIKLEHRKELRTLKARHKRIQQSLILKYNPVFSSPELKSILDREYPDSGQPSLNPFHPGLSKEKVLSSSELATVHSGVRDQESLLKRLDRIDYTNSIAPAIDILRKALFHTVSVYEYMWHRQSTLLMHYRQAMQKLTSLNKEQGYIISATENDNIHFIINDSYRVRSGYQAAVIRGEKNKIATLEFYLRDGYLRARVISREDPAVTVKPLDKILILKNQE